VVCYCDDCQAFAHWLDRAYILDAQGGSDIVQLAPGSMTFTQGEDSIAGMQLKPGGLYRFYASCCHTPLGNMVGPKIPFVGVVVDAFKVEGQDPDAIVGKPIGAIMGRYAVGEPPPGSKGIPLRLMVRAIVKVLAWRLSGRTWPHPFFDRETGQAKFPVKALAPDERARLRPLCGPRPRTEKRPVADGR
jgi:hypothetical protein